MSNCETRTASDIAAVDGKVSLDRQIKVVLANKSILARILAHSMKEFKGMDYDTIISCIESEPEIGSIAVAPGRSNLPKITGSATEDSVPNEGTIYFDIRFYVRIPNVEKEPVKILINIEAQKSFYPGYDIVTRAIYYCARMLSAQLSTEFSVATNDKVKYNNIKKVYSIWICMDTSKSAENTIDEYHIDRKHLVGENKKQTRYDLMSVVIICLSKNKDASSTDNELIGMLLTLLDEDLDVEERKHRLENTYGIPMTAELSQEVENLCNLSEYYEERGIEKGIEKERLSAIERMLKSGKEPKQIASFCGYDLKEILDVQQELLQKV